MSRKRSNRLPKRAPIHVTYDFSPPPAPYVSADKPTSDELNMMDLDVVGIRELVQLSLKCGIDPKVVCGVTNCSVAGRHILIGTRGLATFSVCCEGGAKRPDCESCPNRNKLPEYGIDVFWCRQCFNWVLA